MQIDLPVSAADVAEWDAFVTAHAHGSHWQLSWWLRHHRRRLVTNAVLVVRRRGRIVAGAGYYRFGLPRPLPNVTVVTNAPLVDPAVPAALAVLLRGLEADCRRHSSMLLQLEAFAPELAAAIAAHWSGRRWHAEPLWKLYHPGIWREIRIELAGRTPETLLKSFNRLANRQIRKAEEAGVEVVEARDEAGIREAHDVWVDGAARRGYVVRPFEDFRRLVVESWRRGCGHLLLARVGGEPASFLFSLLLANGACALHTAFTDRHAEIPCNRLLHYRAMCAALERGISSYSLLAPGRGGVRQFKDHFRPVLIDNTRFATLLLQPPLVELARPYIGNTAWMERLKALAVGARRTVTHP